MASYKSLPDHEEEFNSRPQSDTYSLASFSSARPLISRDTTLSDTTTLLNTDSSSSPSSPPPKYKPELNPDIHPTPKPQWYCRLNSSTGWRKGLLFSIVLATVVLILNTSLLVVALRFGSEHTEGVSLVTQASCATTKRQSLWMHLGINILSTMLLGASGYTMQVLGSPTRRDVEWAHEKGDWLEIGSPGWRNLRGHRIGWKRVLVYGGLMASSLPLHLL